MPRPRFPRAKPTDDIDHAWPHGNSALVRATVLEDQRQEKRARHSLAATARTLLAALALGVLTGCVIEEEPEPEPQSSGKRMFASAQLVTGDLGGLAGADSACASWAHAANLGGTWKAFLSTSTVNAPSRIAEVGPWYNVTRQYKVFNNKSGLTVGAINSIRTEYNALATGSAWTGTRANGTADVVTCGDWTTAATSYYGSAGNPSGKLDQGAAWMSKGGNAPACTETLRVYCFEQ